MRQRIKERAVPTDSEVLSYDNVPVDVAAWCLDWPEQTVRLALREGRATFGVAVQGEGLTYKISPGGLVRYKREGVPCLSYETIQSMLRQVVADVVKVELDDFRMELFD